MPDSPQNSERPADVVIRSYNDMPIIESTLAALAAQDMPIRLTAFDNASRLPFPFTPRQKSRREVNCGWRHRCPQSSLTSTFKGISRPNETWVIPEDHLFLVLGSLEEQSGFRVGDEARIHNGWNLFRSIRTFARVVFLSIVFLLLTTNNCRRHTNDQDTRSGVCHARK